MEKHFLQHKPLLRRPGNLTSLLKAVQSKKALLAMYVSEGCRKFWQGSTVHEGLFSSCPVVHIIWYTLCKGSPPPINCGRPCKAHWCSAFSLAQNRSRKGRPFVECVFLRSIARHAMDLWQRVHQSLPATIFTFFRAPPTQLYTCCSCTHPKVPPKRSSSLEN